jgi:hypothetical protein
MLLLSSRSRVPKQVQLKFLIKCFKQKNFSPSHQQLRRTLETFGKHLETDEHVLKRRRVSSFFDIGKKSKTFLLSKV